MQGVNGRPVYRVVVAEDHPVIRELLVQQLQDAGHAVVGVAEDGVRVVEMAEQERPDVVLLDRGLPQQDGLRACASIAARAPTAVVVLSGYLSADPEAEVFAAGGHAFLSKPYSIEDLDEALEQAVHRFARGRARLQPGPSHPASFAS